MDRKLGGLILLVIAGVASGQTPTWHRTDATPAEVATVSAAVAEHMKDPDSAKFKDIYKLASSTGKKAFCGMVNAKNAYGGYAGFSAFYYHPELGFWTTDTDEGRFLVPAACNKPAAP